MISIPTKPRDNKLLNFWIPCGCKVDVVKSEEFSSLTAWETLMNDAKIKFYINDVINLDCRDCESPLSYQVVLTKMTGCLELIMICRNNHTQLSHIHDALNRHETNFTNNIQSRLVTTYEKQYLTVLIQLHKSRRERRSPITCRTHCTKGLRQSTQRATTMRYIWCHVTHHMVCTALLLKCTARADWVRQRYAFSITSTTQHRGLLQGDNEQNDNHLLF